MNCPRRNHRVSRRVHRGRLQRRKFLLARYPPSTEARPSARPSLEPAHMTSSTSSVRTKIIDALYPLDPEGAEDAKENEEPSADADEDKRLRLASMSMLEGVSFKLLVSKTQQGSAATWHDSASATQTVDMVSATLGTDPATRQQVCSPSHPHALLMLAVSLARPLARRSSFASRLSAVWVRSTTSR